MSFSAKTDKIEIMSNLPPLVAEFFQHKTVLVTGGAGFVGSHLAETLVELGAQVIVVDNLITGHLENIAHLTSLPKANFHFIQADVSQEPEKYLKVLSVPDVVLHFASPASPPRYQAYPVETYAANSFATHHLLRYLMAHNPKAVFLFASTSEVYGDPLIHPQTESYWGNVNPNGLRSCYDEAKRLGETICGVHARNYNFDARIVRIFNTYGPRMDLQDGRIIPNFIHQTLKKQPLTIFGDGQQTRSYCHVSDLVAGILLYAATPNLGGETINLGNPGEFTINQTVDVMRQVVHEVAPHLGELKTISQALPADDPLKRQPDITKAKQLLGWQPTVDFKTGLTQTFAYYLQK